MQDVAETSEEVLWTAGFAILIALVVFGVLAWVTWAATMLGSWVGTF